MYVILYCVCAWVGIFLTDFVSSIYPTRICSYKSILKKSFYVSGIIIGMFLLGGVTIFFIASAVERLFS